MRPPILPFAVLAGALIASVAGTVPALAQEDPYPCTNGRVLGICLPGDTSPAKVTPVVEPRKSLINVQLCVDLAIAGLRARSTEVTLSEPDLAVVRAKCETSAVPVIPVAPVPPIQTERTVIVTH